MTTKRIHILTHPLGANYGGIMQAYALQQALRQLGYDPVTLDIPFDRRSPLRRWAKSRLLALKQIPYDQSRKAERIIQQHTSRFVQQHITLSPRLRSAKELREYYRQQPAHAYIVGSDQVWRQAFVPMLDDYFFRFIPESDPVRRIAYAASFGVDPIDIAPERTARYSDLLSRFVAISARELSAVPILKQQFGASAQWVLDPTMLLTREEYIDLFGLREESSREVFAYMLTDTPHKEALAQQIAQSQHTTYQLFSPWRHWTARGESLEECILPPVEAWLEGILNAQYVVTDSFHGVAFSLIFGKPFVAIVNNHGGCSRFDTLIKTFGLESLQEGAYELVSSPERYDVQAIAQKMSQHRTDSMDFIKNALR